MIRHTVVFRLKHPSGSAAEKKFLDDSLALGDLPTVKNFERLKQVSSKNTFTHGFSMEFDGQPAYDAYNVHPVHAAYVRDRWLPEVAEFMEIDYERI
jgi:Stress responsive A/B Barrel Domain